jgi:hypothetical protein
MYSTTESDALSSAHEVAVSQSRGRGIFEFPLNKGNNILDKSLIKVQDRTYSQYELVTLLDLINLHFTLYLHFVRLAGMLERSTKSEIIISDKLWDLVKIVMQEVVEDCTRLDFPLAVNKANNILSMIASNKRSEAFDSVQELRERILEYFEAQSVLMIPFSKRNYYKEPLKEWSDVAHKFPNVIEAIEESEKCFSLSRNTACVFHLMAVVQEGLNVLGGRLKIKVDHFATWEQIIKDIEGAVKAKPNPMLKRNWKLWESFYAEALSDLRWIKNAWRNPTMHFRRTYDETQATKVRERVKEFMQHLGTRLKGKK